MPVGGAIASGVGALGGGLASMFGGNAQADAAKNASQTQLAVYNQTRKDLMPYMNLGNGASNQLSNLLGLNGGNPASMLAALQQTPGYQFAFNQGQTALDRSAASRGMMLSGGQVKDSLQYGQGMADQLYNTTVNQNMGAAQLGENAAAQSGNNGQTAASNSGQFLQNGAEGQAAGYMGMANSLAGNNGVFQNSINAYQLSNNPSYNQQAEQWAQTGSLAMSDARAKEDIVPIGHLDSGLPIYSYRYKGSRLPQIGVIAQDVERIAPHAVHPDPRTGLKRVDYGAVSRLPRFKEAA